MPEDDAIDFIAKNFARPGNVFAHKTKGVKNKFSAASQVEHARTRANQIYDMSDVVAQLRLERNAVLSRHKRRMAGMSRAKAARAKEKARKINKASIREEQTLLARVGVYCDLALMGSSSWSNYHDQLKLGGQREAIVESLGGGWSPRWQPRHGRSPQARRSAPSPSPRRNQSALNHCGKTASSGVIGVTSSDIAESSVKTKKRGDRVTLSRVRQVGMQRKQQ